MSADWSSSKGVKHRLQRKPLEGTFITAVSWWKISSSYKSNVHIDAKLKTESFNPKYMSKQMKKWI